ncbi:MAG: anti-CBASS Acb1 family protein, partial [Candidatus Bathyarchaeia archaeon]
MSSSKKQSSKPYLGIGADASDLRSLSIRKGGAGWRENISDVDREWAADREPIAHRHTYTFANDVYDNWFKIVCEDEKTDYDTPAQKVLTKLNTKQTFINAETYKRIHGYSLIVGAFEDAKTQLDLETPKRKGAKLLASEVYPKTSVSQTIKDEDIESERYGLPEYYVINRGSGIAQSKIHYSRVIHYATDLKEQSVLDVMWDDMTIAKNLRWSMGQTLYTRGPGFPVFTFKGTDRTLLAKAKADIMANWTAWTGFVKNEDMEVKFEGAAGAALNPTPYYEPIFNNLSLATETPTAMLLGTNAGALTGSETNAKDYFKGVSSVQSKAQPLVCQFLDWLFESGQIGAAAKVQSSVGDKIKSLVTKFIHVDAQGIPDYSIEWNPGFEESEQEKSTTDLIKEQAKQIKLQYMTKDEVRALDGLKPLKNGEGESMAQANPFTNDPFNQNNNPDNSSKNPTLNSEKKPEAKGDEVNPADTHPSLPAL